MAEQQTRPDADLDAFTLRLPPAATAELRKIAEARGSKVSIVAREAVLFYLKQRQGRRGS